MVRRSLTGFVMLLASACSSASAPAVDAPESNAAPRVLVSAMLFDAPADGRAPFGSAAPARNVSPETPELSLYDLAKQAGARHVVAPTALAADGAVARMSIPSASPDDAADTPFGRYRLDITPHVDEQGRVQLGVDFDVAGTNAKTTLVVEDKQIVVLSPEALVDDRRIVLLVRPTIVRSEADLKAIADDLSERARRERASADTSSK